MAPFPMKAYLNALSPSNLKRHSLYSLNSGRHAPLNYKGGQLRVLTHKDMWHVPLTEKTGVRFMFDRPIRMHLYSCLGP